MLPGEAALTCQMCVRELQPFLQLDLTDLPMEFGAHPSGDVVQLFQIEPEDHPCRSCLATRVSDTSHNAADTSRSPRSVGRAAEARPVGVVPIAYDRVMAEVTAETADYLSIDSEELARLCEHYGIIELAFLVRLLDARIDPTVMSTCCTPCQTTAISVGRSKSSTISLRRH